MLVVIARSDLSAVALRAKAEATKQSALSLRGEMDCFAEPVIGRRFAPTRWLAMTLRGCLKCEPRECAKSVVPLANTRCRPCESRDP
jgi:hypothetical protein